MLQQTCHEVLHRTDLLPKTKFSYGSSEYNLEYLQDVKDAYRICNQILSSTDFEKKVILYYCTRQNIK